MHAELVVMVWLRGFLADTWYELAWLLLIFGVVYYQVSSEPYRATIEAGFPVGFEVRSTCDAVRAARALTPFPRSREHLVVLFLDPRGRVDAAKVVEGKRASVTYHVEDLRPPGWWLLRTVSTIFVLHNHPSESAQPSDRDRKSAAKRDRHIWSDELVNVVWAPTGDFAVYGGQGIHPKGVGRCAESSA